MLTRKTWSRETAGLLLAVFCWSVYQENVPLVEAIIWPIITYAAVAFGLKRVDSSDKLWRSQPSESTVGRGSERSGQHPVGPGERTDSRPQDFQRAEHSQAERQRYHTDR